MTSQAYRKDVRRSDRYVVSASCHPRTSLPSVYNANMTADVLSSSRKGCCSSVRTNTGNRVVHGLSYRVEREFHRWNVHLRLHDHFPLQLRHQRLLFGHFDSVVVDLWNCVDRCLLTRCWGIAVGRLYSFYFQLGRLNLLALLCLLGSEGRLIFLRTKHKFLP